MKTLLGAATIVTAYELLRRAGLWLDVATDHRLCRIDGVSVMYTHNDLAWVWIGAPLMTVCFVAIVVIGLAVVIGASAYVGEALSR